MDMNTPQTWKKVEPLVAGFLLIAAFFLRFWKLGASPFRADTMEFYKLALRGSGLVELWQNPPWLNQIPLNETFSLFLVYMGLPATPFVVRLPFAVMGFLAVVFIWQLARRQFGAVAGVMVLLFAALNPYEIYISRMAYHYAGATCWSAAMFLGFWALWKRTGSGETPSWKTWGWWYAAAILACHMHMSVWVVAGVQGLLLMMRGFGRGIDRKRYFIPLVVGALVSLLALSRWLFRALKMVAEETQQLGADAGSEFIRLLPAYFAGENGVAVLLLLGCFAASVIALFRPHPERSRFRTLAWVTVVHIAAMFLYIGVVGKGLAKITYFSSLWPMFILTLGVGTALAVESVPKKPWRPGVRLLPGACYVLLALLPALAVVNLEGKPTPYYKINQWLDTHLPPGTPVLVDRWLEPWNELRIHPPESVHYAFTVPDEPLDTYKQVNWRSTAENFFKAYPGAALLEVNRGKYEEDLGSWRFPETYFARQQWITNDAAMTLRQFKVFPTSGYNRANTNRVVTRVFYNTEEDLVQAARARGAPVLRLYGSGWGYAKPGWQQGHWADYRTMNRQAEIVLHNLTDEPVTGTLQIAAAAATGPKTLSVGQSATIMERGKISGLNVPTTLRPGRNVLTLQSPSNDPLFVQDVRWMSPPES